MDDFLDMLSPKEIKQMAKELESLSVKVEKTGSLMKDALDMSGSSKALEKYAQILEKDVNQSFEKIFGKQRKVLTLEEQRLELLKASAKAIRDGDKAQQESLKTLMTSLEKVKSVKEKMPDSVQKVHGALSLMSGIVPTHGLSRTLNLGQGASQLMGGGMSMAKMGMMGGSLALAGYASSRLMGGYQTYKQQAGDVLTGYGRLGEGGMNQIDLYGSNQGFSSIERAKTALSLSEGVRSGVGRVDAGRAVSRNIEQAERQARTYGMGIQQTGGMISQLEQISGRGGALTERMMAQAVTAGVNRARLSSFMEKSMHLTEQVYQSTGKEEAMGINSLLAQIVKNADDKTYAERYTAQAVGQIGEGIKSVGMGGGDLATQGFLSRAFAGKGGEQLDRYSFMKRAQGGATAQNIKDVIKQANQEFKTPEQSSVAMSQMFGLNFKQWETLQSGVSGKGMTDKEVDAFIKKSKKENYIKNTPEGQFYDAIAQNTSEQAKMGKDLLPLATKMIEIQTHIDSGLYAVLDFLGIESKFEKEKRMDLEVASKSTNLMSDVETKAKYGGAKEKAQLEAMKAIEFQNDLIDPSTGKPFLDKKGKPILDQKLGLDQVGSLESLGMEKMKKIGGLTSDLGKHQGLFKNEQTKDDLLVELEKMKTFTTRVKEEKASTTDTEVAKALGEMISKMEKAYEKSAKELKNVGKKWDIFGDFPEKVGKLNDSVLMTLEAVKGNTMVANVGRGR